MPPLCAGPLAHGPGAAAALAVAEAQAEAVAGMPSPALAECPESHAQCGPWPLAHTQPLRRPLPQPLLFLQRKGAALPPCLPSPGMLPLKATLAAPVCSPLLLIVSGLLPLWDEAHICAPAPACTAGYSPRQREGEGEKREEGREREEELLGVFSPAWTDHSTVLGTEACTDR